MHKITVTLDGVAEQPQRRQSRNGGAAALIALAILVAALSTKPQAVTPPITNTTGTIAPLTPATLSIDQKELRFTGPAAQIIRLTNSGDGLLTIQPLVVIGAGFHVSSDCNAPLDRNVSCAVTVSLDPNATGNNTGELRVTSNGGSATVALIGNAISAAPIELPPLDFGRRFLGTAGQPAVVHFTNSAPAALTLGSASTAAPFTIIKDGCATTIESGVGCDVVLSFDPSTTGPQKGDLRIVTADGKLVAHAALSGEAIAPLPQLQLPPVSFGRQPIGKEGKTQFVLLTNSTTNTIAVGGASTEPPFRIVADGCGGKELGPGGMCRMLVAFTASAESRQTGEIRVATTDGYVIARGSLAGFGIAEKQIPVRIDIEPRAMNFNGDPGTRPITVSNRGAAPVSISAKLAMNALGYTIDPTECSRVPLAPGSQCSIMVTSTRAAYKASEPALVEISYEGRTEPVAVTFRAPQKR
jgi:hypothetical protein